MVCVVCVYVCELTGGSRVLLIDLHGVIIV